MAVLSRAPAERTSIAIPTWDLWLTNLVTAVNEATVAAAQPAAAGTLTGTTLAANVVNSSLTSVGTLTGGATGAGFTVALSTSTITGTLADARLSSNVPLINGTNAFTGANSFATNVVDLLVGQLKFPATQNASANANTLDDYEEGTWTPSLGGTTTYGAQTGAYTKIGRLVQVLGHLTITLIGTGSTGVVTGLPFATGSLTAGAVGYFAGAAVNSTFVSCYITASSIVLTSIAAAGPTMNNPAVFFGNGTDVYFALVYSV